MIQVQYENLGKTPMYVVNLSSFIGFNFDEKSANIDGVNKSFKDNGFGNYEICLKKENDKFYLYVYKPIKKEG